MFSKITVLEKTRISSFIESHYLIFNWSKGLNETIIKLFALFEILLIKTVIKNYLPSDHINHQIYPNIFKK